MIKSWPTLYKKSSTGASVQWSIQVDGRRIITKWGQCGGTIQIATDEVKSGKNVGRSNATTAEEQAALEAEATWTKKLKKDYVESLAKVDRGETSALIEGGILPMLAHKFSEHGDKLKYPCYVQPKLDGCRCVAVPDRDEKFTLWSRTRKPIRSMPHIVAELNRLHIDDGLDGELYNHNYRDKFEQLTHFIRQSKPEPGCEVVEYHVYDAPIRGTFRERLDLLGELLGPKGIGPIALVETVKVFNEDELMLAFEGFLAQGYEGAIIRNADGLYVNKRSYDLLKIKKFDDAEFAIVGVNEGRGKMAGHGIFVCRTKDGAQFEAKMVGELSALRQYYEHPDRFIGRLLTVKYQGITTKTKVPRFPVALRVKDSI